MKVSIEEPTASPNGTIRSAQQVALHLCLQPDMVNILSWSLTQIYTCAAKKPDLLIKIFTKWPWLEDNSNQEPNIIGHLNGKRIRLIQTNPQQNGRNGNRPKH